MDLQSQFDAFMSASRKKEIDASDRLQLSEIILKLETVKNKDLPIVFDIPEAKPMWMGSWRWFYAELAIYTEQIGSVQSGEFETHSRWAYPIEKNLWKENPTVSEWLDIMKQCIGATFTGYKGWDFKMSKNSPVSICRENSSSWYSYSNGDYKNTYIVDVIEEDDKIILVTGREN